MDVAASGIGNGSNGRPERIAPAAHTSATLNEIPVCGIRTVSICAGLAIHQLVIDIIRTNDIQAAKFAILTQIGQRIAGLAYIDHRNVVLYQYLLCFQ